MNRMNELWPVPASWLRWLDRGQLTSALCCWWMKDLAGQVMVMAVAGPAPLALVLATVAERVALALVVVVIG